MVFNVGDLVTRKSYNNDIIFKIISIDSTTIYLKGIVVRLIADAFPDDLILYNKKEEELLEIDNREFDNIDPQNNMNRDEYFYLPGRVLHIDSDNEFLNRCIEFYKKNNILAYGIHQEEEEIHKNIRKYLEHTNADIVVITGHDAYYSKKGDKKNIESYQNSNNFVKAVKEARKYEKAHDKLIIIAGACQSDYEELIKAGANFASSPKRINIHALDPAIIATMVGLTDKGVDIDLIGILSKTKYGSDGVGGIKTKGTMYVGFPR